jgi:serine protease
VGVVGVSPNAEIYTVRFFNNNGVFFGSDVIAATEACQDAGANIISMSLGGPRSYLVERQTLEDLYDDGIISIAAAGNSGNSNFGYPASYEIVLSVAAVNSNRNLASFSTHNSRVDVAAPGTKMLKKNVIKTHSAHELIHLSPFSNFRHQCKKYIQQRWLCFSEWYF